MVYLCDFFSLVSVGPLLVLGTVTGRLSFPTPEVSLASVSLLIAEERVSESNQCLHESVCAIRSLSLLQFSSIRMQKSPTDDKLHSDKDQNCSDPKT